MPIEVKTIVKLIITYNDLSSANLGTYLNAINNATYEITHIPKLTISNSCTVFDNSFLLSLTLAQARIPYVGIPN